MPRASASGKSGSSSSKKEIPVELGFLEEDDDQDRFKLKSAFFPSKFGGLPAWLDLQDLPTSQDLKCQSCSKPTKFLLQVYAPEEEPETFHRTIFVFVCTNKVCCLERNSNKNLLVFRCQLPQENAFYSSTPPNESDLTLAQLSPRKFDVKVCKICGAKSTQSCSICKAIHYCGREHQIFDWQEGGHKEKCKNNDVMNPDPEATDQNSYKEMAIVIDTEVIPKQSAKERSEKERMEDYENLKTGGQTGSLAQDTSASTQEMLDAASYKSDKAFNKFKKRVAYHPDQVLRYDKNGKPLWVAAEKKMNAEDVPPCTYCKGPRVFEFQIMPQLLIHVGNDSIIGDLDWGTLAIYTCKKNCNEGQAYKKEFIWQQDFKGDDKNED